MFKRLVNNEKGAILVQAIAVVAAVSAISLLVMNTVDQLSSNSRTTGFDLAKSRAAYQLVKILGSSAGCMNTFSAGGSLPDSDAIITAGPAIVDENLIVRYDHCEQGVTCNTTAFGSYIAGGELRLANSQITDFDSVNNTGTMIFSFYDKDNPNPGANDRKKVVRLSLNVFVDGANNLTDCNFGADNPLQRICDIFGGTLEGDAGAGEEFCKSLFFHQAGTDADNDDLSYIVRDDLQITGDLVSRGSIVLGSTVGDASNPGPGRLSGDGQVDVAGYTSVLDRLNVGAFTTLMYESTNDPGVGQFDHSLWMTNSGTARPAMPVGDLRIDNGGELRVSGRLTYDVSFADNTSMTSTPTQAVTVGWVKRQIAESLASGASLTDIWNELATVATGDVSDAEEVLRTQFCQSVRVINRLTDGTIVNNDAGASCLATVQAMQNNCDSVGNCTNVYANQVCLGPDCYTAKPSWRYNGTCEATQDQAAQNPSPFENYTRRLCDPNKRWLVYNSAGANCCPIKLVP